MSIFILYTKFEGSGLNSSCENYDINLPQKDRKWMKKGGIGAMRLNIHHTLQ